MCTEPGKKTIWIERDLKHSTSNCRILLLMYFISSSDKGNAAKCLAGIRPIPKLCLCPDRQHWSATTMAHCIIQSLLINHIWSRAAMVLEEMKIIIASNYVKSDCCPWLERKFSASNLIKQHLPILCTKHVLLSHSFQNAEEWHRKTFAHHRNGLPTSNYYLFMFS